MASVIGHAAHREREVIGPVAHAPGLYSGRLGAWDVLTEVCSFGWVLSQILILTPGDVGKDFGMLSILQDVGQSLPRGVGVPSPADG